MTVYILIVFIFIKIIQETMYTELPKTALFYFNHSSQQVGWFFLISVIYALPVSILAVWASKAYPDRKVLIVGLVVYLIGTVFKINYTVKKGMYLG